MTVTKKGLSSNLHHSIQMQKQEPKRDKTKTRKKKYYLLLLKLPEASRLIYTAADSIFSTTSSRVFLFQPFIVATKFTSPMTCPFVYSCIFTQPIVYTNFSSSLLLKANSIGLVYARQE